MGKRPKKKVVLYLVEGKSERAALELAVTEMYEQIDPDIQVFFPMMRQIDDKQAGGDITSRHGVWPRNIEEEIYNRFLYDFFDEMKLYPKDISEVVQIVDMDGVYIDDELITVSDERIKYNEETISTSRRDAIIKRNHQKRENLDYLTAIDKISVRQKKVNYSVFFFSVNLDHFIHGDANLDPALKVKLADNFAREHSRAVDKFVDWIMDSPFSLCQSYDESWDFIKNGSNSLKRYTNLGVLINRLRDS